MRQIRAFAQESQLAISRKNGHQLAILFKSINAPYSEYHNVPAIMAELPIDLGEDAEELANSPLFRDNGTILAGEESLLWLYALAAHLRTLHFTFKNDFETAFAEQLVLLQYIQRIFVNSSKWMLPLIYVIGDELWWLARSSNSEEYMQECARAINKTLTICLTDRSPQNASRKWGAYRIMGLLFRIYFHLDQLNLCNNVLRAMGAADLPNLLLYPAAHLVTFRYFLGRYYFVNEDFGRAVGELELCLFHCPRDSTHNKRLILHYLIPAKILASGSLPSPALLMRYNLSPQPFYPRIIESIRKGNLSLYQTILSQYEGTLLKLGTFLVWEKLFILTFRSLIRRIYLLLDKNSRLAINCIHPALRRMRVEMSGEEIECFIANLIDRGLLKGYISHEKSVVVLSQKDPFPNIN